VTPPMTASVEKDVTYTLQWAKNGVVYYEDGLDGKVFETQRYVMEEGAAEPPFAAANGGQIPSRDGYLFDGWTKSTDGTGVPVIYTAKWLAKSFAEEGKQADLTGSISDNDGDGKVTISAEASYVQDHGREETVVAAKLSAAQLSEAISGKDGANQVEELTITLSSSAVTFDQQALKAVVDQTGPRENVTLEVKAVETTSLTKEQQAALDAHEGAIVLSASLVTSSGKKISNFGGGEVTIEIPFTPQEGRGEDFVVYYVAEDGTMTEMPTEHRGGKLIVSMEHFSEYVIMHKSAAPGAAAAASQPQTGDSSSLALWCAMLAACGAGLMRAKRRRA